MVVVQQRHAVSALSVLIFLRRATDLWYERDKVLPRTVAFNMAMMLASASVLLLCFLPPLPALAVACCVVMVVVDLAGHLMTVRPY